MILINQYKFKARMISPMHINKMINYATPSTFMLNMRLVICKPGFKPRLANYKSHIKHKRRTCSIVNHFIDMHGADHSSLKFILIDQNHEDLLKCENFWIGILLTNHKGLNDNHDYVQQ